MATVSFDLRNTGCRAGAEVAQLYLGYPANSAVPEPPKWLRGFQKVSLAPGQTQRVTLRLDPRALSYWDSATHSWSVQTGAFTVTVGGSSRDNRLQGSFQADATGAVSNASPSASAGQPPATVSCPATGTGGGTGGTPTATPEPGSGALYGTGLAALLAGALLAWRRRARSATRGLALKDHSRDRTLKDLCGSDPARTVQDPWPALRCQAATCQAAACQAQAHGVRQHTNQSHPAERATAGRLHP